MCKPNRYPYEISSLKRKAMRIRLIQLVTYENNCSHFLANSSICLAKSRKENPQKLTQLSPTPPPPPPRPLHLIKTNKGKNKKSWIWILCLSLNVYNFTGIPSSTPSPPYPTPQFFFPGFGFLVKIHLLESLKLELYDVRFYSFMTIFIWTYGLYVMC